MNRHFRIFEFAVASLLRYPFKTLAVISVYSLLVALVVSLLLMVGAHRLESHRLLETAPEIIVQRLAGGRHELIPISRTKAIRAIRGVSSVVPRVWGYSYDPPTRATFTLWAAESVPAGALEFHDGATPVNDGLVGCVVGQGVADVRFLGVGDRLPIKTANGELVAPRVEGVFTAQSALLTNDLVVMPSDMVRRIFSMEPGVATDIAVSVTNPHEVDTVARKIQKLWPDVRTITRRQILQTYDAVFDWRGGVWAALLLSCAAAFVILVWDKATGLSAEEYRTVGVLKAVGWKTGDVLELKFWEGGVVSALSVLTGLLAAQIHVVVFDGALFSRVIKGWSVLFPDLDAAPGLNAYIMLVCLPLVVVPYVVASLVPTWRASVTDPDSVMRS